MTKKLRFLLVFLFTSALFANSLQVFATAIKAEPQDIQPPTAQIVSPSDIKPDAMVPVSIFGREKCKFCREEKAFLQDLLKKRGDFEVIYHDIENSVHKLHFDQLTTLEGIPKVTPVTLVGNTVLQGFGGAETTGKRIEELIRSSKGKHTMKFEEFIKAGGSHTVESQKGTCSDDEDASCSAEDIQKSEFLVKLPLLGVIDLRTYSLPLLSVILGFVDGFNPCAMWVLLVFLTLLIETGSKRKMFQVAGIFIVAETIMYYLILNAWYKTWDFVGLDRIVTPIVGTVAVCAGIYFLYEFIKNENECRVTDHAKRKRTIEKIRALVNSPLTLLTALGILGIALSVNIIEFACSIGIPQAFTKVLDLNMLGFLKRQLYMFMYIIFYMIDDFIVFGIAIYSFDKIGVTTKYARVARLIGGVLMLILGLLLVFNPSALAFI